MKKLKYIKLFESFGRLYESVDENYVVKPYEFKTPQDWENEYKPDSSGRNIEINSNTNPPQAEVSDFEAYLDKQVEDKSSYGNEDTFKDIIQFLIERSMIEMFKTKTPNLGSHFWGNDFFSGMYDTDWHKKEDKITEVVENFMSNFSSNSDFERDSDAYSGGYEDSSSGSYSGTTDFKGEEVFSWSSGGDGYNFSGTVDNVEMLYKEIKDYLTMVLYS
jgi:hypothetical protein